MEATKSGFLALALAPDGGLAMIGIIFKLNLCSVFPYLLADTLKGNLALKSVRLGFLPPKVSFRNYMPSFPLNEIKPRTYIDVGGLSRKDNHIKY
jgi:hypothetical protein